MTVGSPPSSTAMHEFVVPRSIPIVFTIPVNCLLVRKSKPFYSRSRDRPNGLLILLGGACWLVHGNRAADKEAGGRMTRALCGAAAVPAVLLLAVAGGAATLPGGTAIDALVTSPLDGATLRDAPLT